MVLVLVLTLCFSRRVVIETFERRTMSIADQEKLLERYNSYSGTVTALLERPLEMYMAVVVPVVVLRVMGNDNTLEMDARAPLVLGAAGAVGSYLLANASSAVNVQVRELPIESVISAGELNASAEDTTVTSTVDKSFAESQAQNPSANTILRNLILSRAVDSRGVCSGDRDLIDSLDTVDYRLPQQPWMKHLRTKALEPKETMRFAIAAYNTPENDALTPEQFPMNASLAADLLVMSYGAENTWGLGAAMYNYSLADTFFREDNNSNYRLFGPTARLTGLLPAKRDTTEREDREWGLKRAAPRLYNISDPETKYASLRSWTMDLTRVDIVPGAVWVDALTVEREIATPRMVTNTSADGKTRYLAYNVNGRAMSPNHLLFAPFDGSTDERITLYQVCTDREGFETLTSSTDGRMNPSIECPTQSNRSLLLLSRGKRLVADELVLNSTVNNSKIVPGSQYDAVVVNLRMVLATTVARITWDVQNLSEIFNARCDASDGCMGFDVPLPGSHQHLVVNASTLPVSLAPPPIDTITKRAVHPLVLMSVRQPQSFTPYQRPSEPEVIGDVLMPHNIRNKTLVPTAVSECDSTIRSRVVAYVDNHLYMESTLQTTYVAAAFFLFQRGVTRDIVNHSATAHTVLAFNGNVQDVDVYVYIPWLNVVLTLTGCVLVMITTAIVVLWPLVRQGDPLERITGPHTIASVLVNENLYPPSLLTRSVADRSEIERGDNAGKLTIQSLTLQREDDDKIV